MAGIGDDRTARLGAEVEVRRSARRQRTVSARREGQRIVVLLPTGLSAEQERHWIERMVARVRRGEQRRRDPVGRGDAELIRRCRELSRRHLDGRAEPSSVRWVPEMRTRWASCSPAEATIRVSRRLAGMPGWVLDYVLVHELTHLLEAGHGPRFWAWVSRYPRTERAIGYLAGVAAASGLDLTDGDLTGDVNADGSDDADNADSSDNTDGTRPDADVGRPAGDPSNDPVPAVTPG